MHSVCLCGWHVAVLSCLPAWLNGKPAAVRGSTLSSSCAGTKCVLRREDPPIHQHHQAEPQALHARAVCVAVRRHPLLLALAPSSGARREV